MKNITLLILSVVFYCFSSVEFILILLTSVIVNFYLGLIIHKSRKTNKYKVLLVGLALNLGLLFYFKYIDFFIGEILNPILNVSSLYQLRSLVVLLPLALSFYTFHTISYLYDVYKGKIKAENNLVNLALYFLLFPHLIAGPIVRFSEISKQINKRIQTLPDFSSGVVRFITGLGKKVLIADIVGPIADEIFAIPPQNMTWETAWLGIICFTLQIYFDFSGYSDMAIGIASMFGFKFPENFNYPYIAGSIREFWQRWHMTLYRWFRDYVYIPIGGNRGSGLKTVFNILAVFALTGLWHGAGWHFIFWGILQGIFIILERLRISFLRFLSVFKYVYTLLAIIVSWVIFRSESISYAASFLKRMFIDFKDPTFEFRQLNYFITNERIIAIILGIILSTPLFKLLLEKSNLEEINSSIFSLLYQSIKLGSLLIIFIISILYIADQTYNPFIYFRF